MSRRSSLPGRSALLVGGSSTVVGRGSLLLGSGVGNGSRARGDHWVIPLRFYFGYPGEGWYGCDRYSSFLGRLRLRGVGQSSAVFGPGAVNEGLGAVFGGDGYPAGYGRAGRQGNYGPARLLSRFWVAVPDGHRGSV